MKDLFTTSAQSRAIMEAGAPAPEHPFGTWAVYYNEHEQLCTCNDIAQVPKHYVPAFSITDLIKMIDVPFMSIDIGAEINISTVEMPYGTIHEASGTSLIDCLVHVAIQYYKAQKPLTTHNSPLK